MILAGSVVAAVGAGAVGIAPREVVAALWRGPGAGLNGTIIWDLRLPRVLMAALAGASLGAAGALFQALFRNPLADPYLIGASAGASLGAVVALVVSPHFEPLGIGAVPAMAFLGAVASVILVYRLAREGGGLSILGLILAGVAVSSFLSALVSLLTYLTADERLHQVVFWLMGGFSGATWRLLAASLPYSLLACLASLLFARDLNALLLGEETAGYLGVEVELAKKAVLGAGALLTAVAVSVGGMVGFVGLVVPHLARMSGGPDHRYLLPASALGGAAALVLADMVSRTVLAPGELPVGLITALLGAPFFLFVLRRRRRMGPPWLPKGG